MNKHVVSLELAQKLVDAGIVMESYFVHARCEDWSESQQVVPKFIIEQDYVLEYEIPAPLPCELMELLPKHIKAYDLLISFLFSGARVSYYYKTIYGEKKYLHSDKWIEADKPADALAQMLLWLKENKYLKEASDGDRLAKLYNKWDSMTDYKMAVEALKLAELMEKELNELKDEMRCMGERYEM